MSNSSCLIAPDPDVAGIGVRVAIYLQALLPLLSIPFVPHSSISTVDVPLVEQYCTRGTRSLVIFLATNAALLIAAIIKRAQRALSPYHALIVLNLTWIILISSCCRAAVMSYLQKHGIPGSFEHQSARRIEEWFGGRTVPDWKGSRIEYLKYSGHVSVSYFHLFAAGILGWMLFSDIDGFAGPAACPRDTVLWIFAFPVHLTDPALRLLWKTAYMITLLWPLSLPLAVFLVTLTFKVTEILIGHLTERISRRLPVRRTRLSLAFAPRGFEMLSVALLIILIVSTEETVAKNPVNKGEDAWGFGQILALTLVGSALYEAQEDVRMSWKLRRVAGQYRSPPV